MIERPVVYKALRTVEKHMKVPLIGACAYEIAAIAFPDSHVPPLTVLAHRHKVIALGVGIAIGLHVWFYDG